MRRLVLPALALLALALGPTGCRARASSISPEPDAGPAGSVAARSRPAPPPSSAPPTPDITPEQALALVLATDQARREPTYRARVTATTAAHHEIELAPPAPEPSVAYPTFRVERPSGRLLQQGLCADQPWVELDWIAFENRAFEQVAALPEVRGYGAMLERLSGGKVRMTMYAESCTRAAPGSGQADEIQVYVGERHEDHTVRGLTFQVDRAGLAVALFRDGAPVSVPYAAWRAGKEAAGYRREATAKPGPRPR